MQEGLFSIIGSRRNKYLSLTVQNHVLFGLVVVYLSIILTLRDVMGCFYRYIFTAIFLLLLATITTTVAVVIVPVVVITSNSNSSSSSSTGNSSTEVGMLTPRGDGSPHTRGFKEIALKRNCIWIEHMVSCCLNNSVQVLQLTLLKLASLLLTSVMLVFIQW